MAENQSTDNKPKEPSTGADYEAYAKSLLGDSTPKDNRVQTEQLGMTYNDQVNALMKEVTTDEQGKIVYPDNTPDSLRYAVAAEKKYRDTQSGFTKGQQSLKEMEAENKALREQLANNSSAPLELSEEKLEQLEDLKFTDADAWRKEINALESEHSIKVQAGLKEQMSEVRSKAGAQHELDRRFEVLAEFNQGRDVPVTPEIMDNDIPPRITKKLADGHLTFEGYLSEINEYLNKGIVVGNPNTGNGTSLNNGAGSHKAPDSAIKQQSEVDYTQLTF